MLSYDQQILGRHSGEGAASYRPRKQAQAANTGWGLLRRARLRALQRALKGALTRKPRRLLALTEVAGCAPILERHHLGVQEVAISQIRGSEGRSSDFDSDFLPLRSQSEDRWISVATALLLDVPLPPVELIQLGKDYFVRDGHHRISVAAALQHTHVDAIVTRWEVPARIAS